MYSGCDKFSLQILFVYSFGTTIPTSSLSFNCFHTCYCLFWLPSGYFMFTFINATWLVSCPACLGTRLILLLNNRRQAITLHSPCLYLEGIKVRSATSLEDLWLVRIVVMLYAQTRVTIEMHSQTNGAKRRTFREACSTGRAASSEVRGEVYSLSCLSIASMSEQSEDVTIAHF